ncbi:serine hydrolase [Aurantibacter crassamenti]|uniref:serine hydrolase domain-containing protein n=1 Tax=Aurantibacter crassamenti TaxID=1837375 RepID=UPI00193A74D9|nr:serine hydrolase [Aurantibacter crassamenti]MBM1106334.1 serine hydrolase [Aurantibacter crassamenti]
MNHRFILFFTFSILFFIGCSSDKMEPVEEKEIEETKISEEIYFPPIGSDEWETISPSELSWDESNTQLLIDFLEEKNTKSFIMLYNGKIVVEHYFNDYSATKPWYWASAGKTLTATVTGIAQDEGIIDINNKVSDYLGEGWTSASLSEENLITAKNLLTMTSGLDDTLGDDVSSENLHYIADAGDRWAYHNVYVKLQDIVSAASNQDWTSYFDIKLKDKIGMSGSWIANNNLNVYWSNTRSMARFGLLIQAKGKWEDQQLVSKEFVLESHNTSQNINEAYGYLWWLNGKTTYHLPSSQLEFNGLLIPTAPADTYAALGKNDQKIYIVPSKSLVVIRMGNAADDANFALSSFDEELWSKINEVIN